MTIQRWDVGGLTYRLCDASDERNRRYGFKISYERVVLVSDLTWVAWEDKRDPLSHFDVFWLAYNAQDLLKDLVQDYNQGRLL